MSKEVAIPYVLAVAVAPTGTFDVPYPAGYVQADFTGANAKTSVMGADHDDLPVTLNANDATITWPAGKGTTLPAGTELTIGLELIGKVENADLKNLLPNQPDSAGGDVATITADFNALLGRLKAAQLMVAD